MGILSFIKDAGEKLFGAVSAPAHAATLKTPANAHAANTTFFI